ncbi:acyl carrier protein [Actinocrispum wychmicini]|uniref:Phosphopantetheine binding protein n=1 Tax=Actinocrispum wychmicini TaxID=1213861 RepID=A0A4R2JNY5_9PSEU|nr:acyl carrier protein [Actinocrispum wychmicini]TCO60697.1 hypothetical protein EV192_103272 [Actinocrispum wychmicini]
MSVLETRDQLWSPVLETLSAQALDCIQTGLSAVVDRFCGAGAHVVLGARQEFVPRIEAGRPPTLEPPVDKRLAEARELAGLHVTDRRDGLDGPALRRFADEAGPLYVLSDTFTMSWTPYRGQRHMDHSYLLIGSGDRYAVVDPYHNDTQWGPARPGVWRLSSADLDAAVGTGASAMVISADGLPDIDPTAILADNARNLAAALDIAGYVAHVRSGLDSVAAIESLVLDIWILGRSRLLHAAWLDTVPGIPADEVRRQADEWLRLAAQSYLGLRRAIRGEPVPPSILDRFEELLAEDVEVAGRLAVRAAVVDAVRTVMRVDDVSVTFRAMPDFSSFRLVDIIERVESRLDLTLDAEDLTLESLHDTDSLTHLFVTAAGRVRQ